MPNSNIFLWCKPPGSRKSEETTEMIPRVRRKIMYFKRTRKTVWFTFVSNRHVLFKKLLSKKTQSKDLLRNAKEFFRVGSR